MLSPKEGIRTIRVDLKNKEGYVEFLPYKITPEQIAEQIEDMGFEAYVKLINGKQVHRGSGGRYLLFIFFSNNEYN